MSKATGLGRNTIDKFYTNPDIANECIVRIQKSLKVDISRDLIIEPSAGDGSFIKGIKKICNNWLFLDIQPENEEIKRMDYLQFEPEKSSYNRIHVVGNPPFGRQSSMTIRFIRKSCEFCDTLSFILPKSFKKDSMKEKVPKNFHLISEWDIPKNGFLIHNEPYDVPCVFQVWEKRDYEREKLLKSEPKGFKFITREGNPHISFRRVGVNAGLIDTDTDKSVQSHYFIRFDNEIDNDVLERLRGIQFDKDNTVGPKSISKGELIDKFNEIL